MWQIHIVMQQRLAQHCKAIILKKKKKKEEWDSKVSVLSNYKDGVTIY